MVCVHACCKSDPSSTLVPFEYLFLLEDEEVEGLVELVVDVLRLHLLRDEVEHDVVDAEVQLLHRLLAVLGPRLGALQPVGQRPAWLFSSVVRFLYLRQRQGCVNLGALWLQGGHSRNLASEFLSCLHFKILK